MKKTILIGALLASLFISACGPAAENREAMHARAKSFQDSIAATIRATLAEAEGPATMVTPVDTAAQRAAATATQNK